VYARIAVVKRQELLPMYDTQRRKKLEKQINNNLTNSYKR